jgi:hypothetical protein
MAASATDKFKKVANNFSSTTTSGIVGGSDTSVTLSSVTNLATDTAIDMVIDRVDATGNKTPAKREYVKGIVSGSQITNLVRGIGNSTAQAHIAGSVIEQVWDQNTWNDAVDGILVNHDQSGNHKSLTDTNGNSIVALSPTSSAVNQVTVANAITGSGPTISATGTDANVNLNLTPKGTGIVNVSGGLTVAGPYSGWSSLTGITPTTVTANGNRSYNMVFNSVDLTGYLSAGMRLKLNRTVTAPTQCTSLNGTSQYYSRASASVAGMTFTNNFVVSAWVKLSSYQAGNIASRYNGTSGWTMNVQSTGQLQLVAFNAGAANYSYVQSYQSLPLNKWVHVTAQLDMATFTATSTTSYVMIDGVDVPAFVSRSGTNPTALIQAGNLEIGTANAGSFLPGKLAQVAIFNAKVTQATIQSYISQGLAGTETSLISAYSFNNSINDLNANANNLTANGSAVATNADSPFGLQADGTTAGTTEYAIITKTAFSTNTTLTVLVPEGNAIPTSGGVSAVSYSVQKAPYNFPAQRGKWRIVTLNNPQTQSSPSASTWYNLGGQINIPTGEWNIDYRTSAYADKVSNLIDISTTLSTSNNSQSDISWNDYVRYYGVGVTTVQISHLLTASGTISLTAQTNYYLNAYTTQASLNIIQLAYGNFSIITAECAYI